MLFWIITGVLALVLTLVLLLALLRGRGIDTPSEVFDLQVYQDQLKEVDSEAERGKISADEAERLRTEISRRILAADAKAQGGGTQTGQPRMLAYALSALVAATVIGGGFGIYTTIGAPGYGDLPLKARIEAAAEARANRPSQAAAEAQTPPVQPPDVPERMVALVARLRDTVATRPDDLRGQELLAQYEAALGNLSAAYTAQAQIIRIKGEDATAKDFVDMADLMIIAAGGYVSPEAQTVLEQALTRDPENGVARFYGGLMMAQTGRPDIGFRMWDRLLRESTADAPWVAPITTQIEEMAFRAGIANYRIPTPALRGPSAEDLADAADMSPEDRAAMIEGMVANLSDRLATNGGPPEEWARLISSLGVLGDTEQASAIWTEARTVFAADAEALTLLEDAARRAGVAE